MNESAKDLLAEANAVIPHISAEEAKTLIDSGEAIAVDVREPVEVAQTGKVPGALTIPRSMIESCANDPSLDRDKTVITYCASGGRSALAAKTLRSFGFKKVFNLGGLKDWVEAGLPVER